MITYTSLTEFMDMELHTVKALSPRDGNLIVYQYVTRVIGGFVYMNWDEEKQDYKDRLFVPEPPPTFRERLIIALAGNSGMTLIDSPQHPEINYERVNARRIIKQADTIILELEVEEYKKNTVQSKLHGDETNERT